MSATAGASTIHDDDVVERRLLRDRQEAADEASELGSVHRPHDLVEDQVQHPVEARKQAAARESVWALEQECDGIFADAALLDLGNKAQVTALIQRCHRYLHKHHVLPELERSVQGLEDTQAAIADRAGDFKQWPWKKADRKEAASEFASKLSELTQYLETIRGREFEHLASGTGPQAFRVQELEDMLTGLQVGELDRARLDKARLELDRRVAWARGDPDKGGWLTLTAELERMNNQLLKQFS
jgi:hypothetical protein